MTVCHLYPLPLQKRRVLYLSVYFVETIRGTSVDGHRA